MKQETYTPSRLDRLASLGLVATIALSGGFFLTHLFLPQGPGLGARLTFLDSSPGFQIFLGSKWAGLLAAAVSGLGACGLGWSMARSRLHERFEQKVSQASREWEGKLSEARDQAQRAAQVTTDLRQLEERFEKEVALRTATLAKELEYVREELEKRRRTERALSQQTKELERSKDVLELHVQARTQEIQKLKGRYEHILNSAGEGIYGLDIKGCTTFVNPAAAKMAGRSVEELVNRNELEAFLDPKSAAALEPHQEINGEQLFIRPDGTTYPVEYVRAPILEKGRLTGSVVIFKDITERKRAEETLARKAAELTRSNAELEQFAYVASHDLQEPLRKIQAFGDRLKAKVVAANLTDGRDFLERMQNAAARMQTLINDLLTFSRVISSSQPFVPVDLGQITREVLSDLEVRIEQTKAQVELGDLATVEADPLQMRQLLQNLIGNALKFQPAGQIPTIKVNSRIIRRKGSREEAEALERLAAENAIVLGDEVCELTVADNGIGFEDVYKEKIFAVFQRLHGRNEYDGTGVGLAVCRRITDRHGGTLTARSQPGEGATFIALLPVKQQIRNSHS